jgi:hypothetical protein
MKGQEPSNKDKHFIIALAEGLICFKAFKNTIGFVPYHGGGRRK